MKIAVIDTMIDLNHKCFRNVTNIVVDKSITISENAETSHGTAVCNILLQNTENVEIVLYPIFKDLNEGIDIDSLLFALEKILADGTFHIINMSCGVVLNNYIDELDNICRKLYMDGTIIVSAYDSRVMTYPACFEYVIGVDVSFSVPSRLEYDYIMNSPVTIQGYAGAMRLAWSNNSYTFLDGSSFITPYITSKIASYLVEEKTNVDIDVIKKHLMKDARKVIKPKEHKNIIYPSFEIKKAIVFPIVKEMNMLFLFRSLLNFEIVGCYDFHNSFNIGASISTIIGNEEGYTSDMKVLDINKIEGFSDIDTIIIGHLDRYKNIVSNEVIQNLMISVIKNNINIYAFNDIIKEFELVNICDKHFNESKYFFPNICENQYPYKNMGKLWTMKTPVVSVIGTKSKQGKYSTMLRMVKKFREIGYKTEFLSTEPNGWLLGAAGVFSYGYHADIDLDISKGIPVINEMLHNIESKNPDIIFCAAQSNILPYDNLFLNSISLYSEVFLFGTNPDAMILNVSLEDEMEYIDRTIQFAESATQAEVIVIEVFPFKSNLSNGKLKRDICQQEVDKKIFDLKQKYPHKLVSSSYLYGELEISEKIIRHLGSS